MLSKEAKSPLWEQVLNLLGILSSSYHSAEREDALVKLLAFNTEELVEVLSAILLSNQGPDIQGYAADALVRVDPRRGRRLIIPLLKSPDPTLRWLVCGLLSNHGDEEAVAPLVSVLCADPEADVRLTAAFALGKIGDPQALSALQWVQQYDDGTDFEGRRVSDAAAQAITEIHAQHPNMDSSTAV
jgi:HEAT repeat protein